MINLYGLNDIDYTKNGKAVLKPTSCLVSEQAGGSYELNMVLPMDARGTYKMAELEDIVKVPVPVATIESAVVGENVDIYKVTTSGSAIRAKPNAPARITYGYWNDGSPSIPAGTKVTYGPTMQNYQATQNIESPASFTPPPQNPAGWTAIANYTSGSPALVNPAVNEELYLISEYNAYWLYVQTHAGIQGYIQKSYVTYVRTETVEQVPERTVSEQLLRIYSLDEDTAKRQLNVRGRHVSYDLSGNLVQECAVTAAEPAVAIARMRAALLFETDGTIATNLTDDDGEFTGDFSWKNPVNALLDPDSGLVNYFKSKLLRDNWDIFLHKNTATNRGVYLRYGTNLRGVRWKRNNQKLINRVVPVATKANGDPLYLPNVWVDSPLIDTYRVIRTEYLKVDGKVGGDDGQGGTWTEAALLEHMEEVAERRFSVDNVDKNTVELSVDFTLVGDTDQYKQYNGLQKLFLYDSVTVMDPGDGIEYTIQVASYEWDCMHKRYTKMTLANVFDYGGRNVSGYNLVNGCIRPNKLSPDTITMLKEAIS